MNLKLFLIKWKRRIYEYILYNLHSLKNINNRQNSFNLTKVEFILYNLDNYSWALKKVETILSLCWLICYSFQLTISFSMKKTTVLHVLKKNQSNLKHNCSSQSNIHFSHCKQSFLRKSAHIVALKISIIFFHKIFVLVK